jgi:DNA-binding MarR family transcriptional regulator/predicted GNAT family acetyltransferase
MPSDTAIAAVREFNRFYTRQIGLLQDGMLGTPFSLSEARVLYEIGQRGTTTAAELAADLEIDPGYLSRLLRGLVDTELVVRERSASDRRQAILAVTARGREAFASLDQRSEELVGALLAKFDETDRRRLVDAMATIRALLNAGASVADAAPSRTVLRAHRPDDLDWMLARHAAIYGSEYGWGLQFRLLVAGIIADFRRGHDPARECCWIAERDGERAGSVMLVDAGDGIAKLRLLLVEPHARGCGIGQSLVEECIRFARAARYRKMTLWTHSILIAARKIYADAGFVRTAVKPHRDFGVDVVGETWDLDL